MTNIEKSVNIKVYITIHVDQGLVYVNTVLEARMKKKVRFDFYTWGKDVIFIICIPYIYML